MEEEAVVSIVSASPYSNRIAVNRAWYTIAVTNAWVTNHSNKACYATAYAWRCECVIQ